MTKTMENATVGKNSTGKCTSNSTKTVSISRLKAAQSLIKTLKERIKRDSDYIQWLEAAANPVAFSANGKRLRMPFINHLHS